MEVGGILTDHSWSVRWSTKKQSFSQNLRKGPQLNSGAAIPAWPIRLYGSCNSRCMGTQSLVLTRMQRALRRSPFPHNPWREYYWRAFNTGNTPKPSIAQALASFLGVQVFGASSGAHIEVSVHNLWITSTQFKNQTGRWPGPPLPLRLQPDRGDYATFHP